MATTSLSTTQTFLLLFSLLLNFTTADVPLSTPVSPTTACNATTDPSFCKSILPTKGSQNFYSYSRFSLVKSLSNAQKFLNLINRYLARRSLSLTAVRALEDCQLLSGLNIDFITSASNALNSTATTTLLDPQTDELQTLLSALLTNQQTCLDGLQATASAWSIKKGLSVPLSNGTKLYSVSLSLFTRAWVPKKKKVKSSRNVSVPSRVSRPGRQLLFHESIEKIREAGVGALPLKMSERDHDLFEQWSGRRLLQVSDAVVVSDIVVVSQDGTGNFTTISDAVNSAPNKTHGSSVYYLIYVNAGVYKEYVLIPKYKKYLMMIGDGINQTVVTGDRNNVDGWTTFNSATFGKWTVHFFNHNYLLKSK